MRTKSETFKEEQEATKKELLVIWDLQDAEFNPEVNTTTLFELDQEDKKSKIIGLIPQIRKYFAVKNKAYFNPEDMKRLHMTIIRDLLKAEYKIQSTFVWEGGMKTRRYHFYPIKTT